MTNEKYKSPENNLRVYYLKNCYLFTINYNYLDVLNENDPNDLCSNRLYIPFIERIWLYKSKIGFSTISKALKIFYHGREEILLDMTQTFYSMSEDEYNKIIPFLLKHQPNLQVGYDSWGYHPPVK